MHKKVYLFFLLCGLFSNSLLAQQVSLTEVPSDSLKVSQQELPGAVPPDAYQLRKDVYSENNYSPVLFRASSTSSLLIGAGIFTIESKGIFNKYKVQEQVRSSLPEGFRIHIDDYTQFIPEIYTIGYTLIQKPGGKNIRKQLTRMAVSNLTMFITVTAAKRIFAVPRPDNEFARTSFPSGHTASAFASATIMHRELGTVSPWYSIAGYTLATTTGALRVMNNRHYISDVLVGAGIGILTTNLSYWAIDAIEKKIERKKRKKRLVLRY